MLEPVSVALKFGFLIVLYLFLMWVVRSAAKDLRRTADGGAVDSGDPNAVGIGPDPNDATGLHTAAGGFGSDGLLEDDEPRLVVERAPGHEAGMVYDIGDSATLGRGNVEIKLEDAFASSRHARVQREGPVIVLEDLGSTNGTYLNGEPLTGPQPLHPGDRIRIGDSEFTYAQ